MASRRHPYQNRPDRTFWNRAVTNRRPIELEELAPTAPDLASFKIATAGSCFAQHIGRVLRQRNLDYMDCEPCPALLRPQAERFGYSLYSCRYGNVYTTRQLIQLFDEAFGQRVPEDIIWEKDDRFFDALRPGIEPDGFSSADEVRTMRQQHLAAVRQMFENLELFVFTLGLTEYWANRADGTAYPTAPGVIAGSYDPDAYEFVNMRVRDVIEDLETFRDRLMQVNPKAEILFTVSPVPLAATASDDHVLVATTYSKSVLRASAGEMAQTYDNVHYFPSYEIITGQPTRHRFYEDDLRSVKKHGVRVVMKHLMGESEIPDETQPDDNAIPPVGFEQCEESLLLKVKDT